jgi:hypothetical protein
LFSFPLYSTHDGSTHDRAPAQRLPCIHRTQARAPCGDAATQWCRGVVMRDMSVSVYVCTCVRVYVYVCV